MHTKTTFIFDYKRIPVENLNKVLAFLYGKEFEPSIDDWEEDAITNNDKSIFNDSYLAWLWANGYVSIEERNWHKEDGTVEKYLWATVDDGMEFDLNYYDEGGINLYEYYYQHNLDKIASLLKEQNIPLL